MRKFSIKSGFTLVELLIVFAIIFVGSTAGIAGFRRFGEAKALDTSASEVESMLNSARINAVTQTIPVSPVCILPKKWVKYSVKIVNTNTYQLNAYCDNDVTTLKTNKLPTGVTFTVPASPDNETFFQMGTGTLTPSIPKSVTLNGAVGPKQITIDIVGNITKH